MTHLNFFILAFSTNFCPIKTDLSGNTIWPQASGFQKLAKMDHFWQFELTFVHSKCKRSSLRLQCWMILFLWLSNTVWRGFLAHNFLAIRSHQMSSSWHPNALCSNVFCTKSTKKRSFLKKEELMSEEYEHLKLVVWSSIKMNEVFTP